jgi:hypothetical protein
MRREASMRGDVVERLFSLFTSSERAEALAGDLFGAAVEPRELAGPAGRMFFVIALGTTVALLAGGVIGQLEVRR